MDGLTAEQEREVQEAIFRRLPNGFSCPLCRGREFTLLARSVVLPERGDPNAPSSGEPVFPAFVLVCSTCAHALLFSALTLNLEHLFRGSVVTGS